MKKYTLSLSLALAMVLVLGVGAGAVSAEEHGHEYEGEMHDRVKPMLIREQVKEVRSHFGINKEQMAERNSGHREKIMMAREAHMEKREEMRAQREERMANMSVEDRVKFEERMEMAHAKRAEKIAEHAKHRVEMQDKFLAERMLGFADGLDERLASIEEKHEVDLSAAHAEIDVARTMIEDAVAMNQAALANLDVVTDVESMDELRAALKELFAPTKEAIHAARDTFKSAIGIAKELVKASKDSN